MMCSPKVGSIVGLAALVALSCAPNVNIVDPGHEGLAQRSSQCPERGCAEYGACALTPDGQCVPSGEDDCILAEVTCEKMGACVFDAQKCKVGALTDDDCDAPRGEFGVNWCRSAGLCAAREGVCFALSDELCAASSICSTKGRCQARGGECVAADLP